MKRNILLFFSILLFNMTACDSLLDKEPETSRTESVTFNNVNDFMLAANYLYSWIPELYTDGVGIIDRDYDADIACEPCHLSVNRQTELQRLTHDIPIIIHTFVLLMSCSPMNTK